MSAGIAMSLEMETECLFSMEISLSILSGYPQCEIRSYPFLEGQAQVSVIRP